MSQISTANIHENLCTKCNTLCPNFTKIGCRLTSSSQRHFSTIFNQHTWRHSPWCPRHEPGSSSDWSRWRGWSPHGREWETVHNTVPHCRAVTQVRRREEVRCYMLANQSLDLFCLNQPEISNVFEPIRDQYCLVSTNQRLVLFSVSQSEISIDLWQPINSEYYLRWNMRSGGESGQSVAGAGV